MPTLTVYMAPRGTPLADKNGVPNGETSVAGHMWYTLDKGDGSPVLSYGFAPVDGATGINRAFGPGDVHKYDIKQYLNTDPSNPIESRSIQISFDQYRKVERLW